ncbi:hypothetical protein Taro_048322, partial [Colocasia esculenta]|nr:hypothetical protein [Colocasia esculenta]
VFLAFFISFSFLPEMTMVVQWDEVGIPRGISRFCQAVSTLVPGSVDTSPSLQKTQLPDWDSVSTQSQAVSILVPEIGQCVDTLPGGVDTLRLKLKNVNFFGHVAAWELGDLT